MAATADPALIVLAWGNASRGDDGVGPLIARRINELGRDDVRVIEDLQLHIEHVMDLRSDIPVLFVDASVAIDAGFRIEKLMPQADNSISTHTVSPHALLNLYETTLGQPAPEAYLLHVCGESFELGEQISTATARHVDAAWEFLAALFSGPSDRWQARLSSAAQ